MTRHPRLPATLVLLSLEEHKKLHEGKPVDIVQPWLRPENKKRRVKYRPLP